MCTNVIRDTQHNYLCIKGGLLHGTETANQTHRWKTDTLPVIIIIILGSTALGELWTPQTLPVNGSKTET
jgi:hypothetical protein